ncbi:MAG: hypothetical protein LIP00_05750, partial [Parabacteroides sp.]|nr:hypothetical protein [Parabacteroides sp.]
MNDKEIETARLEERVRFHVETEYVSDNSVIKIQLFDKDRFSPDDSDFANNKVYENVNIRQNKGCIELDLPVSWTKDLADEPFMHYRKLYWKATIGQTKKDIKSYLNVLFAERTLYVQPLQVEKNFPEIYSSDGSQMAVMLIEQVGLYIRDQSGKYIEKFISDKQLEIVLAKLEKGYLVDSNGKVHSNITQSGNQRRIISSELYASDGSDFIRLNENKTKILYKRGANFGNAHTTTKGVNQFEFFSRTNKKVQMLGAIKNNGGALVAAYDLAKGLQDVQSGNTEGLMDQMLVGFGSVISASAGFGIGVLTAIGNEHWEKREKEYDSDTMQYHTKLLNQAKQQGLNAVKKWLSKNSAPVKGVKYDLMPISYETAANIWQGKVKTWEEIELSTDEDSIYILYRKQNDP